LKKIWRILFIPLILLLARDGHGAVVEKISLYQGDTIDNVNGVTFDGGVFTVPGHEPVPRNNVQLIEFRIEGQEGAAAQDLVQSTGLTPLAKEYLDKGTKMVDAYPGVSGVILVDDGHFEYHPDGTYIYRYRFAGLVLKEEMKAWAQLSLAFTEGKSRTRVLYAHSVNADGTVTTLTSDRLKVGSPSEALVFFNPNQKVLSGTIPGVDVGSIVEYSYEYEEYNPEDPRLFSPGFYFQGSEPVVLSRVKVVTPQDITLNYTTRNFTDTGKGLQPLVEQCDGTVSYTWQLEDMPPVVPEPMMPPTNDLVPMMESSIFKDWDEVFDLLGGLQQKRIRLTPEIEAKVAEITKGTDSIEDKLARIYHWIQENTRYISIKGSLGSGFSGHTAQETFDNRYGDCTDKAILFATMLEAIGVQSYPIIINTNDAGTAVTEIPVMSGNHCISEICLPDRSFYLDTTAQNYRYPYFRADDHGVAAVNAIRGDLKMIPVPPPEDNHRISHLDITLESNGDAIVRTRNAYNGNTEAGVRGFWKRVREDNRKLMMTEYVNSISPGAILDDFTLSDLDDLNVPLTMTIDYTLAKHAIRAKDLMYLRIPTLERNYPEVALETRRYPIQYITTEQRDLEIDLALPAGFHAKWLPPPLEIANPYIEYRAAYEEHEGKILFRETFRRLQRIVPPENYAEYRDALRAIAAFSQQEVFLTGKG